MCHVGTPNDTLFYQPPFLQTEDEAKKAFNQPTMYVGEIYGYKRKNVDSPAKEEVQIHYVTRVWNLYTENRCTFDELFQNTKRPKDKKKFTFRALGGVVLRIAHIKAAWKQLFEQCLTKGDQESCFAGYANDPIGPDRSDAAKEEAEVRLLVVFISLLS